MAAGQKQRTEGVSPKVPVQAIAALVTFALAYFAIDLSPALSGILASLAGVGGGVAASPGTVVTTE